jgi:hypothetical protein
MKEVNQNNTGNMERLEYKIDDLPKHSTQIIKTSNEIPEAILTAESKNTKLITDQIENKFKIFSMFDIKSTTDGLKNLNTLMMDNIKITETNGEDNKMVLAYIEELPNIFNQLQQDINKIIPAEC